MGSNRPSKKQQEILQFVDGFIKGNGYGPSYREVMRGMGYKSVSTVATHIDALIAKGYLQKGGDYSARSLLVVGRDAERSETATQRGLRRTIERLRSAEADRSDDIATLERALELVAEKPQRCEESAS
ncbi:hypothetical protein CR983_02690 [Candidatus Saccharibacteria bacterium]|nr:MAG: hypothetical protein CR983_02690 [Candidatus Saccharibacteria bacterium]